MIVDDIVSLCISYNKSVVLADKHNHTDPIYWFLFSTTFYGCLHQPSSGRDPLTKTVKGGERSNFLMMADAESQKTY